MSYDLKAKSTKEIDAHILSQLATQKRKKE